VKVAIILFTWAADSLNHGAAVPAQPVGDPAILRLPTLTVRRWRASCPAAARQGARDLRKDRRFIAHPGRPETQAGGHWEEALGKDDDQGHDWRGYVCMRYWHPMTRPSCARRALRARCIVLTALYPQFSTTTTASSFKEWNDTARFKVPIKTIASYPTRAGFLAASIELVSRPGRRGWRSQARVVLATAAERIIKAGDPYQAQGRADGEGDCEGWRDRLVDLLSSASVR